MLCFIQGNKKECFGKSLRELFWIIFNQKNRIWNLWEFLKEYTNIKETGLITVPSFHSWVDSQDRWSEQINYRFRSEQKTLESKVPYDQEMTPGNIWKLNTDNFGQME